MSVTYKYVFLSLQNNKESGSTESAEDEDNDAKASGNDSPVHSTQPIKIDADPMGEPVVAKMVHQPIKFNDTPEKNVKIVKPKKA